MQCMRAIKIGNTMDIKNEIKELFDEAQTKEFSRPRSLTLDDLDGSYNDLIVKYSKLLEMEGSKVYGRRSKAIRRSIRKG